MRHDICWEHQKKHGRNCGRGPRPQVQRGWYDCLLLFCGAVFCVICAYCLLTDMLAGVRKIELPRHTWQYVVLTAAGLSVLYGSNVLRRVWMRLLPALPVILAFGRYYVKHRLPVEDGSLYILRMYVVNIAGYYDRILFFPLGVKEEAPAALLFWILLLLIGVFVLAAVIGHMEWMLILPVTLLVAGVTVGKTPRIVSVMLLLVTALLLRMYQMSHTQRLLVRTAQLAGMLGVCLVSGTVCSGMAQRVAGSHHVMMERQLALEDALLALPVWDLFEREGMVTNDAPLTTGKVELEMDLPVLPADNIYLKDYSAERYVNGSWSTDQTAFGIAADEQELSAEAAGAKVWNLPCTAGTEVLDQKNVRELFGQAIVQEVFGYTDITAPEMYDYTIRCRHYGKKAPLPYVSRLPEQLTMDGDQAAFRPWTKKSYGGSLALGQSPLEFPLEYLLDYYVATGWDAGFSSILRLQPQDALEWYNRLAQENYARQDVPASVEQSLNDYIHLIGFADLEELREYSSYVSEHGSLSVNASRLSFASLVQMIMQKFIGRYSQNLDPLPQGTDPVDYFLNTSMEGYCVHYASAATLMLQAMGIPARYASGYVVFPEDFEKSSDGYTAEVTDERAHAWAEIYLEDFGWMPLEVTPGYAGGTADEEAQDPAQPGEDDASQDVTDTGETEHENEPDDIPEEETEQDASPDEGRDTAGGVSDEKLSGAALRRWLGRLAGLLGAALVVWLAAAACRVRKKRQEERLRREIRDGQYKSAINRMNRRIYRRLRQRNPMGGMSMRDDDGYRRVLERQEYARGMDVDAYMRLVRQAHFSGGEMCVEDAQTVYGVYRAVFDRGRKKKK